ncbi:MAG: TonB family protein [Bacteroidales bacterium]|nr:TonB family protein [Bacteroidales bacterium]
MIQFFIYSLKAGLFMVLFYAVYYLLLSRDTAYLRNRFYLLGSSVIAWLLPALQFSFGPQINPDSVPDLLIEIITVGNYSSNELLATSDSWPGVLGIAAYIYTAGIILFSLRLIAGMAGLLRLLSSGTVSKNIVTVDKATRFSGFSAMGLIFISNSLPEEEKDKVILHEKIHIRLMHYIDIILFEIIIILQWMNPFVYLIRYSIRAVHEYHTDQEYISGTGTIAEYQRMLFNEIFGTRNIPIASCFSAKSLIKKRMIMMTKKETRPGAAAKVLIAVPLAAALILLFSCNERIESPENPIQPAMTEEPAEVIIFLVGDTATSTLFVARDKLDAVKDSIMKVHAAAIKKANTPKPVVNQPIKEKEPVYREIDPSNDIFMIVEDMPTFEGGDIQKFSNWVKANVTYPPIAQANGIQGKVFIGFVVEPDGSVSNVTVLRSVDKVLDDEAVRIVKSSPLWEPGYQRGRAVRVRFSITVNFVLN